MQKIDAKSQPKVSGEMIHISNSTPRDSQRNTAIDETFAARPNTKGGTNIRSSQQTWYRKA
jgi:hypothetical protein